MCQFIGYKEPTHLECSIRWWNIYSNYGVCPTAKSDDINLLRKFHELQKMDLKGLPIPKSCTSSMIPITNDELIPKEFRPTKFPTCYNYPNLTVQEKDLQTQIHSVAGLTQFSSLDFKNSQNAIFDLEVNVTYEKEIKESVEDGLDVSANIHPYSDLKPYFDDLTSYMEGRCTLEHVKKIKKFFQSQIGFFQKIAFDEMEGEKTETAKVKEKRKQARFVSSTIPLSKKTKAHGTKY